jgi:hypothetical protein
MINDQATGENRAESCRAANSFMNTSTSSELEPDICPSKYCAISNGNCANLLDMGCFAVVKENQLIHESRFWKVGVSLLRGNRLPADREIWHTVDRVVRRTIECVLCNASFSSVRNFCLKSCRSLAFAVSGPR